VKKHSNKSEKEIRKKSCKEAGKENKESENFKAESQEIKAA